MSYRLVLESLLKSREDKYTKGHIEVIDGIDKKFYMLLHNLYKPFLSTGHLKDRGQYSIYLDKKLVGFIQRGKFLQLAFIPDMRGRGISKRALEILVQKYNIDKIGWTADKHNYPSLKLLYELGGGIYKDDNSRKKVEGFYKPNPNNSDKKYNALLKPIVDKAKILYKSWVSTEYDKRYKEQKELNEYLSGPKGKLK